MRFWIALLLIACNGCSTMKQAEAKWLPYHDVDVQLRRKLEMRPDQLVLSCRNLIIAGSFETAETLKPGPVLERIIVADATSSYYDNRTGQLVATCGYWPCSRNPHYCQTSCPPKAWSCSPAP